MPKDSILAIKKNYKSAVQYHPDHENIYSTALANSTHSGFRSPNPVESYQPSSSESLSTTGSLTNDMDKLLQMERTDSSLSHHSNHSSSSIESGNRRKRERGSVAGKSEKMWRELSADSMNGSETALDFTTKLVTGVSDVSIRVAKEKSTISYSAAQLDNRIQQAVDMLVADGSFSLNHKSLQTLPQNFTERKLHRLATKRPKVVPDWSTESTGDRKMNADISSIADQAVKMKSMTEICDIGMPIALEESISRRSNTPKTTEQVALK